MKCTLDNCPHRQTAISQLRGRRLLGLLGKSLAAAISSFLATIAGPSGSAFADEVAVRVMTQNMYVGADFSLLDSATTPAEFIAAVTQIYQNILAIKSAERAAAVAREIARERPDLVALQEAFILHTGSAPATNVVSDQLESLLNELRRLG